MRFVGIVLLISGLIYLVKPTVFRRGIWTKTSLAQRSLSPEGYINYMRVLGLIYILVGIVLIVTGR